MPYICDTPKPLTAVQALAKQLGWNGLQLWRQDFDDREAIHWYQTTDMKFWLFISEYPFGQDEIFSATVYAVRYRICSGHHRFSLSDPGAVTKLMPWTKRQLFRIPAWRRELRRRYPNFVMHRRNKIGWSHPPFEAWEEKPEPLSMYNWF